MMYLKIRYGREYEYGVIRDFISEVQTVPFRLEDAEVSGEVWMKLRAMALK